MSEPNSQSRWQWAAILVLAVGLIYVGSQSLGGAARGRDAVERLAEVQDRLDAAVTEQRDVTKGLAQVTEQVGAAVRGVEEARAAAETLQQGMDDRLAALQSQLEPAVAGQQSEARRLSQLEEQVFTAVTRQQAAAQRVTELAEQVESVTQELEETRADVDAVREAVAGLAAASPVPAAAQLPETWTNDLQMTFVLVPAGSFDMGSESGDDDERPVRTVPVDVPFYISQFEVTQAQWFSVMESDPSAFSDDDNRPVENVSWNDAQAFIDKLNATDPAATYRLPTEVEWEYAARAGSTAAYGYGDDPAELDAYAWYAGNADNTTHPVGEKQPNAWDIHAMHGGVWEWVQNRYGPYAPSAGAESPDPPPGLRRVLRGGSWLSPAGDCRAASRSHAHPAFRGSHVGFRLVRTIP